MISIVAVLAALLLPAIDKARAAARQTICLSHLRQLHNGAAAYGTDYNGSLPSAWRTQPGGNAGKFDFSMSSRKKATLARGYPTTKAGYSPKYVFFREGYYTLDVLIDPAQPWEFLRRGDNESYDPREIVGNFNTVYTAYGYRFTSAATWQWGWPGSPGDFPRFQELQHVLSTIQHPGSHVLFWDGASERRDPTTLAPRRRDDHLNWAHRTGGNMVGFNGAAKWVPNVLRQGTSKDKKASWPAYDTQGAVWLTEVEQGFLPHGYDWYFRHPGKEP